MKTVNEVAADFLRRDSGQKLKTMFNGEECNVKLALKVLTLGVMIENGIQEDGGNELFFSGTLGGAAFTFSILGEGIGKMVEEYAKK